MISAPGALAEVNPFRYRSCYYDTETWFYYLQSRYYDPSIGRFINADIFVSTGQGILGNNMYAYCGNNPISYSDSLGGRREPCKKAFNMAGLSRITDQNDEPWGDIPFGSSTVGEMGCGLVAVYNAMLSLYDHRPFSEIYAFFDNYPSGLTDHGKNGVFMLYIAAYFYHEGYRVIIVPSQNTDQIMLYSQHADACIMLYQYGSYPNTGGHYIEYTRSMGYFIGHNTAEGQGTYAFNSPIEYGGDGDRSVFWGIFVFSP